MNKAIELLAITGKALANAEKEYKKAFTKHYYTLKESKEPSTTILKIIYGIDEVAELREKRDIAEVEYKVAQEKLYALKNQKFINFKDQNEKEKIDYYSKKADEIGKKDNDILEDFNNLDLNFDVDDRSEKFPKIIEDFYNYTENK
jgi:hypothetical protein